jgi:L,D-transpeptidase-like protein
MFKKTVKKYILSTSLIFSLFVFSLFFSHLGVDNLGQSNYSDSKFSQINGKTQIRKVSVRINPQENSDVLIRKYLTCLYPLISESTLEKIIGGKTISKTLVNDTLGIIDINAVVNVPAYYFEVSPQILWVLNLPEFKTRFYQVYNGDTILIDAWDCSVGDPKTQTHPGHFRALKIRNWPIWKDPDTDSPPVNPGVKNPLGLFTIHYDERSTRQFHGTNIDNPQLNSYGAVSHGCIRNNNDNIEKLKAYVIKKVVKSENLSSWLNSSKTMAYQFKKEDSLNFTIIYKTFEVDNDENGNYIIFFKDVYGFAEKLWTDIDDPSLITITTIDNVVNELRREHRSTGISDDKLIPILEKLIAEHGYYEKYYFKDLTSGSGTYLTANTD